jgi:hypothetical protein
MKPSGKNDSGCVELNRFQLYPATEMQIVHPLPIICVHLRPSAVLFLFLE